MTNEENSLKQFYEDVNSVFSDCLGYVNVHNYAKILVTKEKLPTQSGKFTTIATLQALAEIHAIFDLALV